ncbi:MAG TPA: chloride channel protein [Candidatus Hydrogenedentes bacterium]|nr:chloride channel protein [Candidatus Hydrogenedentota bacterium]HPG66284.1 chloride channel protein [Candidatus Hydrogenedentota bacterium]
MEFARKYWRLFADRVRSSDTVGPVVLAVTIGAGAGFAAIAFRWTISAVHFLLQEELGGVLSKGLGAAFTIPVIALGGLLVGLITKYFAPETKGHGVPEVMVAVAHNGGRIRPRTTFFKILAAALSIGSGGSTGREGPIVQIGSAFGSTIGQLFRLPTRRVVLSVACGAAGGIAATFNAPMAGVIFALEVILNRFTAMSFGLMVVSSATATVVARSLLPEGAAPAFAILHEFNMKSMWDLPLFVVMGILCAIIAQVYIRTLCAVEDVTERIDIPEFWKPAIGGALVGVFAIWTPEIMGTGYETIARTLNSEMLMGTLFLLTVMKIVCTSLTIGSGGSGGIFAPALFIGAVFGGGYGCVVQQLFPNVTATPGAYAMVGMAAVFAGAAHAPITSILILFEMTDNYRIIVPLMCATVAATVVSQRILHESIYTIKLKRRGISITESPEVNLMDAVTVADAMDEFVDAVPPNLPVPALIERLTREHETGYPVINVDGRLVGVVTMRDVEEALLGRDPETLVVSDICTKNVIVGRPDQTLSSALAQFGARNFGRLPVIDPDHPDRVIGILKRKNIVLAYAEAYRRSREMAPKADAIQAISERSEMVIEQGRVSSGSLLAGLALRDAQFPTDSILGAIRRGEQTIVPRGSTRIMPGDEVVVLTTRENAAAVHRWLEEHI